MAEFKQKIHSILAQMWQYNSGLRTLDNKNGNWKHLHVHWTLPLKDEKEEMLIETLNGTVLGLKGLNEVILENETESSSELVEKQKQKQKCKLFLFVLDKLVAIFYHILF